MSTLCLYHIVLIFVVSFEMGKCVCVLNLLFFYIALAVSGLLQFHTSFRISLSISAKVKAAGMFIRIWLVWISLGVLPL